MDGSISRPVYSWDASAFVMLIPFPDATIDTGVILNVFVTSPE